MGSVFDIFKIGIGPSSSHTVGPMRAGKAFIDQLIDNEQMPLVTKIVADIYGSLSLTGKGHQYIMVNTKSIFPVKVLYFILLFYHYTKME